jgi:hypothetical protein
MNFIKRIIGLLPQYKDFGHCLKCKVKWALTKHHTTNYKPNVGCFPLCENCWEKLKTPEKRMIYYKKLLDSWALEAKRQKLYNKLEYDEDWKNIQKAVLAGK